MSSDAQFSNPTVYTEEAWFKTTTTRGGKIIGFGRARAGSSGGYDRHVYMQDDGRLVFGVWTGQPNTVTTSGVYNDGQWHHVVATQSGEGMKLYVDGVLSGTNPQTQAQDYNGLLEGRWRQHLGLLQRLLRRHHRRGGGLLQGAVRGRGSRRTSLPGADVLNQMPVAAFTSTTDQRQVAFDASASSDPDGSVAAYTLELR